MHGGGLSWMEGSWCVQKRFQGDRGVHGQLFSSRAASEHLQGMLCVAAYGWMTIAAAANPASWYCGVFTTEAAHHTALQHCETPLRLCTLLYMGMTAHVAGYRLQFTQ